MGPGARRVRGDDHFAGNLQGRTQTLPLAVFEQLQTDTDAAFAVSMLLILLAFAVILVAPRSVPPMTLGST